MFAKTVSVLLGIIFACQFVLAQETTGTISGRVTDSTGAVVPGANVTILNEETGVSRLVKSDTSGRYMAPSLSVGRYRITASLEGFQTEVRSGIVLTVGRNAVIDLALSVGAVAQTVEVTGEAPMVETKDSTVAYLVGGNAIRELPINGRDLTKLILLTPGVNESMVNTKNSTQSYGTRFSIAGSRGEDNAYLLDGTYMSDTNRHIPASPSGALLGVETVQEFQVLTNSYNAAYGRSLGGVFSAVSKSGSNEWHGDLYEFLRNADLDARKFFDIANAPAPSPVPPFKRNQFGATFGGPIRRDKTFFFVAYEGMREQLSSTAISTVPDLTARSGGIVPVSSTIAPYLQLWPLPSPNGKDFVGGTAQYIFQSNQSTRDDFGQVRVDHYLSESSSFFARFTGSNGGRDNDGSLPGFGTVNVNNNRLLTLSGTHIFSPHVLDTARFSFNRVYPFDDVSYAPAFPPELESFAGQGPPTLSPGSGVTSTAMLGTDLLVSNRFAFYNDTNYTRGSHALKFGGNLERVQVNDHRGNIPNGMWGWSSLTSFLSAGDPTSYRGTPSSLSPDFGLRQWLFALFVQDDWSVRPGLTLNLGLRWEPYSVASEVNNRLVNLRNITDPHGTLGDPFWLNHSRTDLGPRFGFAWTPFANGKTSVRGGVGLFFVPFDAAAYRSSVGRNYPYAPEFRFALSGHTQFPNGPAEIQALTLCTALFDCSSYGSVEDPDFQNSRSPRALKYNLIVQRQLSSNTVFSVGYTATRGYHNTTYNNMNLPPPVFDGNAYTYPATTTVINPKFALAQIIRTNGDSWYNGLLTSFEHRFSGGFQVQLAYTYSKLIDYIDGGTKTADVSTGGSGPQKNPYDLNAQRGLSGYDVRNALRINYSYGLPFGRKGSGVVGHLVSGWELSGITTIQSGQPIWITSSMPTTMNTVTAGGAGNVSPNLTPGYTSDQITWGAPNASKDPTGLGRYFNPAGFTWAGALSLGNLGRNTLTGPGLATWDFALKKDISLSERWHLQFRSEFFNLFNRPNFLPPSASVFGSTGSATGSAAQITDTFDAREIQFGLKLIF